VCVSLLFTEPLFPECAPGCYEDNTNIYRMLDDFNNLAPTMKFTLEEEQNNKINFLDITITKNHNLYIIYNK
jgi:hypothetical protein